MIYHEQFIQDRETESTYDSCLEERTCWFDRWPNVFPNADLFTYNTIWEDVS